MPQGIYPGNKGKIIPLEVRLKISRTMKGRPAYNKGKKHTPETLKKMSIAHSGSSNHFFGKIHSFETREKIRQASLRNNPRYWLGKKRIFTQDLINRMAQARKGENNGNWKGGITPLNHTIRNSINYIEWRKAVFERDDYRCYDCGERGSELNAHHTYPFARFPRLRFDINNGVTLCETCHHQTFVYMGNQFQTI